jgi:hypothetical protein
MKYQTMFDYFDANDFEMNITKPAEKKTEEGDIS